MPAQSQLPDMAHPHHYVLEEPRGATSVGTCKLCGFQRPFSNYEEEMGDRKAWNDKGKRLGKKKSVMLPGSLYGYAS